MKKNNYKWASATAVIVLLVFAVAVRNPFKSMNEKKLGVAVVAGFMQPFSEIAAQFEKKTGIKIEATYSSAGKLYSQVINGAPYHIILADEDRAKRLFSEGYGHEPFIYAKGEVVLWTARKDLCGAADWRDVVKRKDVKKIAIANPEIAVYGMSAKMALQKTGLWNTVESHFIQSSDLAQVFQYAITEAVDAGFCNLFQAYSDKGKTGCFYRMEEAPPVIHSACVLKKIGNSASALLLADYLVSTEAEKIKNKYGYK